jgi:hypothetical protein
LFHEEAFQLVPCTAERRRLAHLESMSTPLRDDDRAQGQNAGQRGPHAGER